MDKALRALFILALPIVLVITNVNWAFNSLWLYKYSFTKYQVPAYSGVPLDDLVAASEQMIGFFEGEGEFPNIAVLKGNQRSPLFNDREVRHLEDVRGLLRRLTTIQRVAALYIAAYIPVTLWLFRSAGLQGLLNMVVKSGVGTVLALVVVAVLSLVGFDQLFLQFHLISFSNDLWMLDPSRDYLVMMFPQGFWFDAAMLVGLATSLEALVLAGLSGVIMWLSNRRAVVPGDIS